VSKILIVDDDAKTRKLLRAVLQNSGYEIIEAENGEQGIKLAKENIPVLILMDIEMPVMDGMSAFKVIRADESTKNIPVIALTSYAMKGDKEKFLAEGFDNYISKPIDVKEFMKIVKKHIKDSE
jgi:two-component system cell cycle response regulator DivK